MLIACPMSEPEVRSTKWTPLNSAVSGCMAQSCQQRRRQFSGKRVRLPSGEVLGLGELDEKLDRAARGYQRAFEVYQRGFLAVKEFLAQGRISRDVAAEWVLAINPKVNELVEKLRAYPKAKAEIEKLASEMRDGVGVVPIAAAGLAKGLMWLIGVITVSVATVGTVALLTADSAEEKAMASAGAAIKNAPPDVQREYLKALRGGGSAGWLEDIGGTLLKAGLFAVAGYAAWKIGSAWVSKKAESVAEGKPLLGNLVPTVKNMLSRRPASAPPSAPTV